MSEVVADEMTTYHTDKSKTLFFIQEDFSNFTIRCKVILQIIFINVVSQVANIQPASTREFGLSKRFDLQVDS